jgi:hypothetical protein
MSIANGDAPNFHMPNNAEFDVDDAGIRLMMA